ncbi:hypothetical protein ACWC5I_00440 [Kitasatospora sp. NPDC001574]
MSNSNTEVGELAAFATAAYLATKLAFVSALVQICEETDTDAPALFAALEEDSRIGPLRPVPEFDTWEFRAFLSTLRAEGSGTLEFFRTMDRFPRQFTVAESSHRQP